MVFRALGSTNGEGKFDWESAICDATIIAALSFFTTLSALGLTGLFDNPVEGITTGFISAMIQFFTILAIKRGLMQDNKK